MLEEGTAADSRECRSYAALDAVLSATAASPRERVDALRRYPAAGYACRRRWSSSWRSRWPKQASADAAGTLFHDRFFPREEGGTSVRSVYAQVRADLRRVAAERGACDAALAILDSLPHEQPGLAFTAGGLADTMGAAPMVMQIAESNRSAAGGKPARARWERLARRFNADGAPLTMAIADSAPARGLARPRTAAEQAALEQALDGRDRDARIGAARAVPD